MEKKYFEKKVLKKLNFLAYDTPTTNISPFGPALWPARGNIYMNVLFYYIEDEENVEKVEKVENV